MTTHVVIGPRTRLGAALTDRLVSQSARVLLVARDDRDAAALAGAGAPVSRTEDAAASISGNEDLVIHICALGPIHPAPPAAADAERFERELGAIDALVTASSGAVRLMYVSSVIALAPTDDRRLYGGWKNIAEERLDRLALAHRDRVTMGVLYPGRIFGPGDRRGLGDRLSSTYARVADRLLRETGRDPRRRIVGLDARIWAGLRAMSLVVHVVRTRRTPSSLATTATTRPPIDERHP